MSGSDIWTLWPNLVSCCHSLIAIWQKAGAYCLVGLVMCHEFEILLYTFWQNLNQKLQECYATCCTYKTQNFLYKFYSVWKLIFWITMADSLNPVQRTKKKNEKCWFGPCVPLNSQSACEIELEGLECGSPHSYFTFPLCFWKNTGHFK